MIAHGVSSRSSHSGAAGRITSAAKSCTHCWIWSWSSLSSIEKLVIGPPGRPDPKLLVGNPAYPLMRGPQPPPGTGRNHPVGQNDLGGPLGPRRLQGEAQMARRSIAFLRATACIVAAAGMMVAAGGPAAAERTFTGVQYHPITFPVDGPVRYTDDFGDCRSGCTHRHEGNDLMGRKLLHEVAA